jgi:lipoprotein NlpI
MKRIPFLTILLFQIAILLGLAPVSALGSEEKAKALFDRGVDHYQAGDTAKELADYTAVIAMRDAPAEAKATALYNRGVTHANAGNTAKALVDFTTVIEMKDAPAELKAQARSNRDQLR